MSRVSFLLAMGTRSVNRKSVFCASGVGTWRFEEDFNGCVLRILRCLGVNCSLISVPGMFVWVCVSCFPTPKQFFTRAMSLRLQVRKVPLAELKLAKEKARQLALGRRGGLGADRGCGGWGPKPQVWVYFLTLF